MLVRILLELPSALLIQVCRKCRKTPSLVIMPGELRQFAKDQGRDAAARVALMERSILVLLVAGLSWASWRL